MSRLVRSLAFLLVLALVPPALGASPASAATTPGATTDGAVVRAVLQFLKKNWLPVYVMFDELVDDVCGCGGGGAPPPPPTMEPDPVPMPPY